MSEVREQGIGRLLVVAAGTFFSVGLLAALGPVLPELATNNNTSLAAIGSIYTAIFMGAVPAQLLSGWANDRYGTRPVLAAGLLLLAIGLAGGLLSRNLPLTLGCMLFAGLGNGALIVGANVMVARTFAGRSASVLNLMNVFYGIGAFAGPAMAGVALGAWGSSLPALWTLVAFLVALLPLTLGLGAGVGIEARGEAQSDQERKLGEPSRVRPFYLEPALWILCLVLLLYVGVEVGTGGWIATYMQRTAQIPPESAALVASGFYLALTGGRLLGAATGTKLSSDRLLGLSLLLSVAAGVGLLASVGSGALTTAAVLVLGAALGPVYPTMLALVAGRYPRAAGRAASAVMASGSLGGMLVPWIFGAGIGELGAPSLAWGVAAITLAMAALFWGVRLTGRRAGSPTRSEGEVSVLSRTAAK